MFRTLLRWSWRDLRSRWVQVAAIALIIAIGTGTFAAFESLTRWRRDSNTASYEITNVHDLRGRLGGGGFLPAGTLADAVGSIDHADSIESIDERLIVSTQLDASFDDQEIVVRGRIVGLEFANGGPEVDIPQPDTGRALTADDAGRDVGTIEANFARHYGLPDNGTLLLSGGRPLEYVGHSTHPEYFVVVSDGGGFFGERNLGVVFTSLETAGRIAGQPGAVNDVVVTLAEGADREVVQAEMAAALRGLGATVQTIDDDASYRSVIRDVEGDQDTTRVISFAVLLGAVFAAFNLTSRMVEAQRREIGVAMAIGVPRRLIALRPMLAGLQIALLGALFGIGVGYLMSVGLRSLLVSLIAIPIVETPFQFDIYAGAAALGVLAPLLAISLPVWLAVRVAPVDAIRTGHLAARGWGIAPLLRRLPVPGGSLARMPLRNLLRAPRRTGLTMIAIAASMTVLVGVLVVLDAILDQGARSQAEIAGDHPERLIVDLDTVYSLDAPEYTRIADSPELTSTEPITRLLATLLDDGPGIGILLDFVNFESEVWAPTAGEGALDTSEPGIILARKAGDDLGVGIGDVVPLRYVVRDAGGLRVVETELPVLGFHGNPFRIYAFVDRSHLDLVGLEGTANQVTGLPAPGRTEADVKRALLDVAHVGSVQSAESVGDVFGDVIDDMAAFFYLLVASAVGLAGLIAFNSAAINADERRREHATMFAYGVPPHRVLLVAVTESTLLGSVATALGILGGLAFAGWIIEVTLARTAPDLGADVVVTPVTVATAIVLGVVAVALAPVFTFRRMRGMDIPSTLRVME